MKGGADVRERSGELGEAQLIGCWARPSRGWSHVNGNLTVLSRGGFPDGLGEQCA